MSAESNALWGSVLAEIRTNVSETQFEMWFRRLDIGTFGPDRLELVVGHAFQQEWLQRRFRDVILDAVEKVTGDRPVLSITVSETTAATAVREGSPPPAAPSDPAAVPLARERLARRKASIDLDERYTFENFVVGPSNALCHAAAQAICATADPRTYNPFFVHGGVGLGKTHLLQAVCHRFLDADPETRVVYMSCERFVNQFIHALEQQKIEQFRSRYRQVDVLVIDDIGFLVNKERTQDEFFHTFNSLYSAGKRVILSSDSSPADIPSLGERLVSRFKWGLVCEIAPPNFEMRVSLARRKAALLGARLRDDVVLYLAENLRTNVRELEGAVNRLVGQMQLLREDIDVPRAAEVLSDLIRADARRVTMERIIEAVVEIFGVRLADLQSKKRPQSITLPRHVCMYLARQITRHSLEEIGGYLGGRDHSTVLYGAERIEAEMATDPRLRAQVDRIMTRLTGGSGPHKGADPAERSASSEASEG